MNYRDKLKQRIEILTSCEAFGVIDEQDGPSTPYEGHLAGKNEGLCQALEIYDEHVQKVGHLVPVQEFEGLSAKLLDLARGALERSRHEAYPKTASEVEGYSRGLQVAGERLQALLAELQARQ